MGKPLKDVVGERAQLVGTVLTLPGATAAELLAEPFDVVWIDLEHAALGPREAQEMILGAQAARAYALVRLPAEARTLMAMVLDAGADGVVLANVRKVSEVAAVAELMAHPPDGTRGWGPRRLALRARGSGQRPPAPSLWTQIESAEGVANAGDIARVPAVDAVVVGASDLSFAMGAPQDMRSPRLLAAIAAVAEQVAEANVAFGLAGPLDRVPPTACERASILVHNTDARLCADAVDKAAAWMRRAGR